MKSDYPRLVISADLRRKMVEFAREFRKEPTHSEEILWEALRAKKLDGIKFRRQQPVGPFVVDFYASTLRLVVEIDGPIHEYQQEADRARQEILEQLGLKIVRLSAGEVEHSLPTALAKIRASLPNSPSPLVGEGVGGEGCSRGEG